MSMSNPEFNARIARIASGTGSSKSTIYVGLDEVYHVTYARRGKPAGAVGAIGNALLAALVTVAIGLGAVSFGLASWIRFRMAGLGAGSPDAMTEMAIQAGAAVAVALVIGRALPFRAPMLKLVMAASAVTTTFFYHNAVHLYPDAFVQLFSPDWVQLVQGSTEPLSVVWQGRSFTF